MEPAFLKKQEVSLRNFYDVIQYIKLFVRVLQLSAAPQLVCTSLQDGGDRNHVAVIAQVNVDAKRANKKDFGNMAYVSRLLKPSDCI
jgi:hypothetical protein